MSRRSRKKPNFRLPRGRGAKLRVVDADDDDDEVDRGTVAAASWYRESGGDAALPATRMTSVGRRAV